MIFFTADHHFYHTNIIRYCSRPFVTVEEMNEEMVKRWNSVVSPGDIVYYLGDFSLAKRPVEYFAPRLNGEKHLIMGNHDPCHPIHKKKAALGAEVYRNAGFQTLELERTLEIAGTTVLLNHMPYQSKEAENTAENRRYSIPRHAKYRPPDHGLWLLHGHIHEKWKSKDKMINVGVDVWEFYPVPITTIEGLIQGATG